MVASVPSLETLSAVRAAYDAGDPLGAFQIGTATHELPAWRGAEARVLAGRLAYNLGGGRLAQVLHALAWREHPHEPECIYFYGRTLLATRGPWRTLEFIGANREYFTTATPDTQAEWTALEGLCLGLLRDWSRADVRLRQAHELAPGNRWLQIEKGALLEAQDRIDDALEAAQTLRRDHPWYRPAVQQHARLLRLRGDDDAARELLQSACERIDSLPVVEQLLAMDLETKRYDDVEALLERAVQLAPCADRAERQRFDSWRFELACHARDRARALSLARAIDIPFFDQVAENIERVDAITGPTILPVPFVRQNFRTCGPATLEALCRYWNREADQADIIETIWFDGTHDYHERRWAEDNDFAVKEFRLSWGSATALIDAEIPFALSTVETASAHMQAVIGYDAARRTLLLRDPTEPGYSELLVDGGIDYYASSGPRAMVFVPRERAHELDHFDLPEAKSYRLYHELRTALDGHDRDRANASLGRLQCLAPDSRLSLLATRTLAQYDNDEESSLHCTERLLERFPDDLRLLSSKSLSLDALGRRDEQLALLESIRQRRYADPSFVQAWASHLIPDAREHERVNLALQRLTRQAPYDAETYLQIGRLRWETGRFDAALEAYRAAACLSDLQERYVRTYCRAARLRNQAGSALAILEDGAMRFGHLSARPTLSYCQALEEFDRFDDALTTADTALESRPEDPELHLYLASLHTRMGDIQAGRAHLARAREGTHDVGWHQAAAEIAHFEGDLHRALEHYQRIGELEPTNPAAVTRHFGLIRDLEGHGPAVTWLRALRARFPYHYDVNVQLIEALRTGPPLDYLEAIEAHLACHPTDTWGLREHALALLHGGRDGDALSTIDRALSIGPNDCHNHSVRAHILRRQGQREEARAGFRDALTLNADDSDAIMGLFDTCRTQDERREAATFVETQFVRQVLIGDGLLTFAHYARTAIGDSQAKRALQAAFDARPDLWEAWAALAQTELDSGNAAAAHELLEQACERFPALPRLWLERALAERALGDVQAERRCLHQALTFNPDYPDAVRALADSYERAADLAGARDVIEPALVRNPLDPYLHGYLADYEWRAGETESAIAHVQRAVELDPDYEWAWGHLARWAEEAGKGDLVLEVAREAVERRPGDTRARIRLARHLESPEERLALLDLALDSEPANEDAHAIRMQTLSSLGRHDEGLACLDAPVWAGRPPAGLRLAAARVAAEQDQIDAAIEIVQALLADDPNAPAALRDLADFYDAAGHPEKYLDTAERMVEVSPRDGRSHAYLADAYTQLERRDEAWAAISQATHLAPDYLFAQDRRLTMALERADFAAAEDAMALLAANATGSPVHVRELNLAVAREDRERARKSLHALCGADFGDLELLREGLATATPLLGEAEVEQIITGMLDDQNAGRALGYIWGKRRGNPKQWRPQLDTLERIAERGEVGLGALEAYLEALALPGDPRWIDDAISRWGDILHGDARTWGSTTEMYRSRGLHEAAARWSADWAERSAVNGWSLFEAALAQWELTNHHQALAVHEWAEQRYPDHMLPYHQTLAAVANALDSNTEEARARLERSEGAELTPYYAGVRSIADALITLDENACNRELDLTPARRALRRARKDVPPGQDALFDKLYQVAHRRLSTRCYPRLPGWLARLITRP